MSRYERDHGGIGRMLKAEGECAGLAENIHARAALVAKRAEALSRRDTGAYASSWEVTRIDPGGVHHDRVEYQVSNDDQAAVFNEFGNGHNEPPHTLLKALGAAGGDT